MSAKVPARASVFTLKNCAAWFNPRLMPYPSGSHQNEKTWSTQPAGLHSSLVKETFMAIDLTVRDIIHKVTAKFVHAFLPDAE
jgi:hypothetical protein